MYEQKIIENLREFSAKYQYEDQKLSETCFRAADAIEDLQKQIPSADMVEVVRCKDCKNNYVTTHNHGKQDDPRCDFTDRHLSLDDFCSRGERRMDGE